MVVLFCLKAKSCFFHIFLCLGLHSGAVSALSPHSKKARVQIPGGTSQCFPHAVWVLFRHTTSFRSPKRYSIRLISASKLSFSVSVCVWLYGPSVTFELLSLKGLLWGGIIPESYTKLYPNSEQPSISSHSAVLVLTVSAHLSHRRLFFKDTNRFT